MKTTSQLAEKLRRAEDYQEIIKDAAEGAAQRQSSAGGGKDGTMNQPQTTPKLPFRQLMEKATGFANLPRDTKLSFSKIVHDLPYECQLGMVEDMARFCEEHADE